VINKSRQSFQTLEMLKIHNAEIKKEGLSPESLRKSLCMCVSVGWHVELGCHVWEVSTCATAVIAGRLLPVSTGKTQSQAQKKNKEDGGEIRWRSSQLTHYCFLLLPLSLLGPFELPLLVVPPVLLPLQPLMLVVLVAVVPAGEKDTHDITVLARPLNSPCLLTTARNNCEDSPRSSPPIFSPLMVERGISNEKEMDMLIRCHCDYGAPRIGSREPGSCNCQHNFTCHCFLLS